MRELLIDLADKIFKESLRTGLEEAEFYAVWINAVEAKISRDHVKNVSRISKTVYGVRGASDKRVASIGSEDLLADPAALAKQLYSLIKSSPRDENWRGFATGYSRGVMPDLYDKKTAEISVEEILGLLETAFEESREAARRVGAEKALITRGSLSIGEGGVFIANTYGENIYDEYTTVNMYYAVKSRKRGEESSYYATVSNRRLDEEEVLEEAHRAGEFSAKFVGAKQVPSGDYKVLLDPRMAAFFIGTSLAPAFSALNVQEKRSPLRGRLNQKVLSENVNIRDEPGINWGVGSRSFDDEGIPTRTKLLIDKGVLASYLYDYYTAGRDGVSSTGNGFRRSPSSAPTPSPTNIVVEPVGSSAGKEELLEILGTGIIVHGMIGYWMSNYVNGSVQATITHGFYVENGEVKYPVKGLVIGGNIYDWLGKDLLAIGREIVKTENIYAPDILVGKARIASK